nr:putative transcriptional regulatory protein pb1a11.04c [Quercus suber]
MTSHRRVFQAAVSHQGAAMRATLIGGYSNCSGNILHTGAGQWWGEDKTILRSLPTVWYCVCRGLLVLHSPGALFGLNSFRSPGPEPGEKRGYRLVRCRCESSRVKGRVQVSYSTLVVIVGAGSSTTLLVRRPGPRSTDRRRHLRQLLPVSYLTLHSSIHSRVFLHSTPYRHPSLLSLSRPVGRAAIRHFSTSATLSSAHSRLIAPSANIASTTTAAAYTRSSVVREAAGLLQARVRMRSSIACVRCRRSKVKCVNNGAGTTCRSCENSGRDCQYPSPIAGTPRRRDSLSGRADVAQEGEKKRVRKSANNVSSFGGHGLGDSSRSLSDPLDPKLLTPAVWLELFEIFQLHFSADLPFLHKSTFIRPLQAAQSQPGESLGRPPFSDDFLLAFLALTARFHPKLVAFHCSPSGGRQSNPSAASDYYADAVNARLATTSMNPSLERTQATLMLGLHEWGNCRGAQAWLLVGTAIRAAQLMGLQYELDLDDEPLSLSMALDFEAKKLGLIMRKAKSSTSTHQTKEDHFIYQEVRRRTFWSCYILDRYLSSGKYRPQMLHARELRIQLPASERAFVFGTNVRTLMLGEAEKHVNRADVQGSRQASVMLATGGGTPEPGAERTRGNFYADDHEDDAVDMETGMNEGLVSRYIKILEIWTKVVRWSCAGGRQ